MNDDRSQGQSDPSADPEQRAFTGGADMPPQQPDQPAQENEELLRKKHEEEAPAAAPEGGGNPHGDYPSLPGYGG